MNFLMAGMMVFAEIVGALIYMRTRRTLARTALACAGLGFAVAIVFADIIPDATEGYSELTPTFFACLAAGAALALLAGYGGRAIGRYTAVLGFTFHNFCEGVVLTTTAAISPLIAVGLVMHKLPEGMVSYALLDGVPDKLRFGIACASALMIPCGALLPIPESAAQPLTAVAAGVILAIVAVAMRVLLAQYVSQPRSRFAMATLGGAVVGGLSCLLV